MSLIIWALVGKSNTLLVPRSRTRNSCLWGESDAIVAFAKPYGGISCVIGTESVERKEHSSEMER